MSSSIFFNLVLVSISLSTMFFLLRPRFRQNEHWQATLTPLSSIIGSGFLVMAPLLASVVGILSPLAVLAIVLLAYGIGTVIRFNILHVEPRIKCGNTSRMTQQVEYLGNISLCLAYMVAVAFYLSLLSSFVMNYFGYSDITLERWLTTSIIIIIAVVGYLKGLGGLEKLESVSMTVQLSIVAALLFGLFVFGYNFLESGKALNFSYPEREWSTQVRILAGALLVVQGFETSRFIGERYSPEIRVSSMRNAQIMSGALYIVAVIALMPVVQHLDLMHIQLAKIVDVTGLVAVALPIMLIIAALMSQFSAAVADTGGAGGLLNENSQSKLSTNVSYVGVSAAAILLVWSVDLLQIITLASRAFAIYYFLQALLALTYCYKDCARESRMTLWTRILFFVIALILLYVVFFAISAE